MSGRKSKWSGRRSHSSTSEDSSSDKRFSNDTDRRKNRSGSRDRRKDRVDELNSRNGPRPTSRDAKKKSNSSGRRDRSRSRENSSKRRPDNSRARGARDNSRDRRDDARRESNAPRDRRNRSTSRSNRDESKYKRHDLNSASSSKCKPTGSSNNKHKSSHAQKQKRRSSSSDSSSSGSSNSSSSSSASSTSSSNSSNQSVKLLQKLETNRIKEAVVKKKLKEQRKLMETPEEKRARRLREKLAKERKRRERMGWDTEYQHYTNQDNPFGDAHLTSTFVWNKKLEKKGMKGIATDELEIINRQKQLENKMELEKVKKRRQERELERMQREEEMVLLQRSREAAQFEEYACQEDQFHLEQARLRSKIRIQDRRAKPIDLLAQYVSNQSLEETIEMQMHEPYTYLNGLSVSDLEDLLVDIRVYIELDKSNQNTDYWEDLTIIVQDELQKLKKMEQGGENNADGGGREGIHQSVARDVTDIFRGKTTQQLNELKSKIELKLETRCDGVDIGYWESLLSQLKAHMARARLKDQHHENLRAKLELLKKEQVETVTSSTHDDGDTDNKPSTSYVSNVKDEPMDEESRADENASPYCSDNEEQAAKDLLSDSFMLYTEGNYSPAYLADNDIDTNAIVVNAEEADRDLEKFQNRVLNLGIGGDGDEDDNPYSKEEIRMARDARKGMDGDEAEFSVETKVDSQVYLWSDKYRPRKPRYFNRVHTGFEWNKYNQTHYDMDNPPPKIVQGYKFNIFYPDLIDKGCTPQYFLTPCPENKDFAVLRFHAGPPYEDLAFKIVNREWEFSYKRGFRCQFHNNIFQLWFHFKRYRYRR